MKNFLVPILHVVTVSMVLAVPLAVHGRERGGASARAVVAPVSVDPAFAVRIGKAASADRVARVAGLFRLANGRSLLSALGEVSDGAVTSFRADDIAFDIVTFEHAPLHVEHAKVALTPAADGRSVRFEVSGVPFGEGSSLEAKGVVEWAVGPLGGDRLEVRLELHGAPVEAMRTLAPERFHESIVGSVDVVGSASGIVGETSSEDAPATPLNGEATVKVDWRVLGRTSPLLLRTGFSLDDRSVRLKGGRMEWQGLGLDISGWFDPGTTGKFTVTGKYEKVDAAAVASDWGVPEAWRPEALVSGKVEFFGTPGDGKLRYEIAASQIVVPALGGYTIRLVQPTLKGTLAAINAEFNASVRASSVRIGDMDLGDVPVGIQWWRGKLQVTIANSRLWGGEAATTLSYTPAEHPAFSMSGRLGSGVGRQIAAGLVPGLGLDVDGAGSVAFFVHQDGEYRRSFLATASLSSGRFSAQSVFAATLAALSAAEPSLASPAASALVPAPKEGAGTRVDRLFLEVAAVNPAWPLESDLDVGGVFLRSGEFQLDGDGELVSAKDLRIDATVTLPVAVADALQKGAPWLSALRGPGSSLFVPVTVSGSPASPSVKLAASYVDLLAQARAGAEVSAPGIRDVRHLDVKRLAPIPADPSRGEME